MWAGGGRAGRRRGRRRGRGRGELTLPRRPTRRRRLARGTGLAANVPTYSGVAAEGWPVCRHTARRCNSCTGSGSGAVTGFDFGEKEQRPIFGTDLGKTGTVLRTWYRTGQNRNGFANLVLYAIRTTAPAPPRPTPACAQPVNPDGVITYRGHIRMSADQHGQWWAPRRQPRRCCP